MRRLKKYWKATFVLGSGDPGAGVVNASECPWDLKSKTVR